MPTLTKTCLCLLSSALLLLNACKREPEPQKYLGNYPLGEVKDYLYFKPGSYWVYECDSTGELDSQVMVSIDTPWFHKSYIDYQVLFFIRKSITHNVVFSTDNFYDVRYNSNFSYFDAYNINISGNGTSAYDCVFFYPFDSLKYGYGSSPTYYKGYLDSLQVLGKWYKDVRVFQYGTSGFIRPNYKTEILRDARMTMFWAKNVGVVKYYIQGGLWDNNLTPFWFNWNLKRYSIKK